ncbi:MAG: hypothetical protein NZ518_00075 [Dehalococcoidia bacterium]|nr:hypothetical protein [Dehalococcoidia bacterium]
MSSVIERIASWLGIDNMHSLHALDFAVDDAGRIARLSARMMQNVDIVDGGKVRTRPGTSLAQAVAGIPRCLWAPQDGQYGYYAVGGTLYRWAPTESPHPVTNIHPQARIVYADTPIGVVVSDGFGIQLVRGTQAYPISAEPLGAPTLTVTTGGGYTAGLRRVRVTAVDVLGREGPASPVAEADVPADGGLTATLPTPLDPGTTKIRVYMTDASGSVYRLAAEVPAATTTVALPAVHDGLLLDEQRLVRMPAAHCLCWWSGRLWWGRGTMVAWSPPMRPGLWEPATAWYRAPGPVRWIAGVAAGAEGAGLYVGHDLGVEWLGGADPAGWSRSTVSTVGALRGEALLIDAPIVGSEARGRVVVWVDRQGRLCIGGPGGQMRVASGDRYALDVAQRVSAALREHEGNRHMLFALRHPTSSPVSATDRVTVTVYDHRGHPVA